VKQSEIDNKLTQGGARDLLAEEVEMVDGVPDQYLAASKKPLPPDQAEAFKSAVTTIHEQMARISIVPTWARCYDLGAGRLPGFLRELAERGAS
jgi:hypothetical protein